MNQLSGRYVNVVLSVECGRGMDFLKNKVYITGNFNNRILESDHIAPEESPPFNTELVWEIEKKELRKIRCGNVPLRVECISVDLQNRKERIGFALLSLRSAQILPESLGSQPATPKWYKLMGCQADKRKCCPELYLSLSLRDNLINEKINIDCTGKMPFILEEDIQVQEEKVGSPKDFPVKYFENGHIQIGDEQSASIAFTLNMKVMDVQNLDALLPEALVFQANNERFFLKFKILGVVIKTKPFQSQIHGKIVLNERIVINLLSTKKILDAFFKTQTVSTSFYYGSEKLGVAKFRVQNVWDETCEKFYFKIPNSDDLIPYGSTDKSPFITLDLWITETPPQQPKPLICKEQLDRPKSRSIFSNINKTPEEQPDVQNPHNSEIPTKLTKVVSVEAVASPVTIKSVETIVDSGTLGTLSASSTAFSIFQKYVLRVSLKYFIWTSPSEITKIMFKFLHPKASSCTTIFTELDNEVDKEVALHNFNIRLAYISTPDNIENLLKYWRPKLVLADENEEYISDQKTLDLKGIETSSTDFEVEFYRSKRQVPMAKVGITMTLKKMGSRLEEDYENLFLLPVILDEVIAVNEIYELDVWKEGRKQKFDAELERLKNEETTRLRKEYEERKNKLQTKLEKTIDKCERLQEELSSKVSSLRFNKYFINMKNESQSKKIFEDVLAENSNRYCQEDTKLLIELLSKEQTDNQVLREICENQKKEICSINKSIQAKEETTILLQDLKSLEENFSLACASKKYFLEQVQSVAAESDNKEIEDYDLQITKTDERDDTLSMTSLEKFLESCKEISDVKSVEY